MTEVDGPNLSEAIGGGKLNALTTDRDGNLRPVPIGTNPDIGAYESMLVPVEISVFELD